MPFRPRINTVPIARKNAETSISISASGLCSTTGSSPNTNTPMKLTAIAAPVRQRMLSPNHHHANKAAIGT